jgi:hypothetical protein
MAPPALPAPAGPPPPPWAPIATEAQRANPSATNDPVDREVLVTDVSFSGLANRCLHDADMFLEKPWEGYE